MWVFYHGMAHSQVAYGGDSLKIWRVAVKILNKQLQTTNKEWYSAWGLVKGLTTRHKKQLVTKCYTGPQTWQALVNMVMNLQVP
jgi:hypothetical protein